LAQFSYDSPQDFRKWVEESNYIVVLSTENEDSLKDIINKLEDEGLDHSVFVEPDLDNQVTALAISPKHSEWASRWLSSLPLAMKEYNIMSNQEKQTV
jgi:peptidyl-tRNA hydrolase